MGGSGTAQPVKKRIKIVKKDKRDKGEKEERIY
jgi:hypothetical protein